MRIVLLVLTACIEDRRLAVTRITGYMWRTRRSFVETLLRQVLHVQLLTRTVRAHCRDVVTVLETERRVVPHELDHVSLWLLLLLLAFRDERFR